METNKCIYVNISDTIKMNLQLSRYPDTLFRGPPIVSDGLVPIFTKF